MKKDTIVYSTDPHWKETCPVCEEPVTSCKCGQSDSRSAITSAILIKREKKGRGGKTVTTVTGVRPDPKQMQKALQKLCGAGGTLKNGVIEIQGDQREKIRAYLENKGLKTKIGG
jgi:translation initiation factor 1